jgi:hypothetical protein
MAGRISRGWRLVKASGAVLRQEKGLLVLPALSFLLIGGAATGFWFLGWDEFAGDGELTTSHYVFLFAFYFVASFVGIFFNAIVVGVAMLRLQGRDPTLGDGVRLAASKLGKIAGWAAVSATVGVILRSLEERFGWVGDIAVAIAGAAWSAITFFVIPVLLYEPMGVFPAVKRSARIFKQRWGEQFVGTASIALGLFLVWLPFALVGVGIAVVSRPLGIAIVVLSVAAFVSLSSVLTGIFNAALYRFATTGEASGPFDASDLEASFRPRR